MCVFRLTNPIHFASNRATFWLSAHAVTHWIRAAIQRWSTYFCHSSRTGKYLETAAARLFAAIIQTSAFSGLIPYGFQIMKITHISHHYSYRDYSWRVLWGSHISHTFLVNFYQKLYITCVKHNNIMSYIIKVKHTLYNSP